MKNFDRPISKTPFRHFDWPAENSPQSLALKRIPAGRSRAEVSRQAAEAV
jgi:hypothetical protein